MAGGIRPIMEVCKFASPLDVIQQVCKVSSPFSKACASDELWQCYASDTNPAYRFPPGCPSKKEVYIQTFIKKIVQLTPNALYILLLPLRRPSVRLLSSPVSTDPASVYTLLPNDSLFLCGGFLPNTYHISLRSGNVHPSPPPLVQRSYPGLTPLPPSIYHFGGLRDGAALRRAEKFTVVTETWRDVQKMTFPHAQFSPCLVGFNVYLMGSEGCEVFRSKSETFLPLEIGLAVGNEGVITVFDGDSLVVVGNTDVKRVKITGKLTVIAGKTTKKRQLHLENQQNLVINREAYFLLHSKVVKMSLDSFEFVEFAKMR